MIEQSPIDQPLSEQQKAEAERIYQRLGPVFEQERRRMAELLASKADHEILGATEHQVRDQVHRLGAEAIEAALDERQKKGGILGC